MKRFGCFSVLMAALVGASGCAQNNEETANITGVAPEGGGSSDAASYEDYSKRMMEQQKQQYQGSSYPGGGR